MVELVDEKVWGTFESALSVLRLPMLLFGAGVNLPGWWNW